MPKFETIQAQDTIQETSKVTTGFFAGGVGTLAGSNFTSKSLADSNEEYFFTLQYSSTDHFSVAYGDLQGSGSGDTTNFGQSKVVYKQFATILQTPSEVTGGFVFSGSTSPDRDIFFLTAHRTRMKDRINRKNWTLQLSGSTTAGSGTTLYLTDDSNTVTSVATPVGPRYNVVSGALGSVNTAATTKNYGWFYPNLGIWVLRQSELSSSVPGVPHSATGSTWNDTGSGVGFGTLDRTNDDTWTTHNALKLANSLVLGTHTMRNEEDQVTTSHFCRAKSQDFNFSTNPTYTSGSDNRMYQSSFEGNPQSFISTVGLYDGQQNLVAVGRLSTPIKKNYSSEVTIKVNLTY